MASGGVLLGAYEYMQRQVVTDPRCVDPSTLKKSKTKTKMSMRDSAKYLAQSKYIRDLATLVIGYGMAINIVEVTWKANLKAALPGPGRLLRLHGGLFFYYGWRYVIHDARRAKDTEEVRLGRRCGRDTCHTASYGLRVLLARLKTGRLGAALWCARYDAADARRTSRRGAEHRVQVHEVRAVRPVQGDGLHTALDAEQKTKGKAAVDVIGNPLGKSGGALVQQMLILSLGSSRRARRTSRRSSSASSSSGCARRGRSRGSSRRRWRPEIDPLFCSLYKNPSRAFPAR